MRECSYHFVFFRKNTFNKKYIPYDYDYIQKIFKKKDENGRKYKITRRGNKVYLDDEPGDPVTTVWNDILSFNYVAPANLEGEGYPTQKPEALLARIVNGSSNEGDLIADFFCGSGTTAIVAEKLNRRWICADLSMYGIHITTKRLLGIDELKAYKVEDYYRSFRPFVIQKLDNYVKSKFQQKYKDKVELPLEEYINSLLSNKLNISREGDFKPFHGKKDNIL